jgi:hypothetical protein
MFLDAEYLIENLNWVPEICNRFKNQWLWLKDGKCLKHQPYNSAPRMSLRSLCGYFHGPLGKPGNH